MSSRYWVRLFINTLLIGGITAGTVGLVVAWEDFRSQSLLGLFVSFLWLMGIGFIFSVVSQMCFFAYLTVHRLGLSIFKSSFLWNAVQLVLVIIVLADLAYLRFVFFAGENEQLTSFIGYPILLLVVGLAVGVVKAKQTNWHAFIPALFFMIVVTVIEWFPVLRVNEQGWMYYMLVPLLVCNAYQLLILPKYHEKSEEAAKERNERKRLNKTKTAQS